MFSWWDNCDTKHSFRHFCWDVQTGGVKLKFIWNNLIKVLLQLLKSHQFRASTTSEIHLISWFKKIGNRSKKNNSLKSLIYKKKKKKKFITPESGSSTAVREDHFNKLGIIWITILFQLAGFHSEQFNAEHCAFATEKWEP